MMRSSMRCSRPVRESFLNAHGTTGISLWGLLPLTSYRHCPKGNWRESFSAARYSALGATRPSLFPAFSSQECLKALVYFEDEALRELPGHLEERLLSAIKSVRSIPTVVLDSTSLND